MKMITPKTQKLIAKSNDTFRAYSDLCDQIRRDGNYNFEAAQRAALAKSEWNMRKVEAAFAIADDVDARLLK